MDRPDHVAMKTKMWSTDTEWEPNANEDPIELFKLDETGKQVLPTGTPNLVQPEFNLKQNFEDIRNNVGKMKNFLNHEQTVWWNHLFESPEAHFSTLEEWYLNVLQPLQPDTPQEIVEWTESPLQLAMERERNALPVYSGKRKARSKTNKATPTKNKKSIRADIGYMVAVEEEDEMLVGKVSDIGNTTLNIVPFNGTLNGCWEPVTTPSGKTYIKTIAKNSVKDNMVFYLTASKKLPAVVKNNLMKHIS